MNTRTVENEPRISIIGLGNVLLGDDGFGPCVVELFRCGYECDPEVEIVDLGTPGLDLTPYLYGRDLVVIADAVDAPNSPGTVCCYKYEDVPTRTVQLRLTGHDPGLTEAVAQLRLLGQAPAELIVIGAVPESCEFNEGISSSVLKAASAVVHSIAGLLVNRGVHCPRRLAPLSANLWWLSDDRSREVVMRLPLITESAKHGGQP